MGAQLLTTNAKGLEYLAAQVKDIEKAFQEWEEEMKINPTRSAGR